MNDPSQVGRKDPSVVGASGYDRIERDFYPTPKSCMDSLIQALGDDIPAFAVWEPFAGDAAILKHITPLTGRTVGTDIHAYEGYDADLLTDFFKVLRDDASEGEVFAAGDGALFMSDIAALKGFRPDAIVSNPPYGKEAERAARHALHLMQPEHGTVIFLCRHDWDCASRRRDLFDHPAFSMKITMRHRPRWIEGTTTAPRFAYAWYVWDWQKANLAPHTKPELMYVR